MGGIFFHIPDPFVPSGSPAHWYDATTLVLDNNDPVETWSDLAGSNDLAQSVLANRPLYQSSGGAPISNPHVLGSDVTKQFMTAPFSAIIQPVTIFIIAAPITLGNGEFVIASHTVRGCELQQNGQWVIYSGSFGNGGLVGWSNGVWSCFAILFNGAASTFRVNGVQQGGLLDPGSIGMDGVTIGAARADGWPVAPANIGWGEIIIYNGAEDPTDNEAMLMTKWGI